MHNRLMPIKLADLKKFGDAAVGTIVVKENAFFAYIIVGTHPFQAECHNWPSHTQSEPADLFIPYNQKELMKLFSARWAQIFSQYPKMVTQKEILLQRQARQSWIKVLDQ